MFEVTVDYESSACPTTRRIEGYADLALFLERVPNQLGYLANQKVTIVVETIFPKQDTALF